MPSAIFSIIEDLRTLYRSSAVNRAFFDDLTRRKNNASATKVDRTLSILRQSHVAVTRRDIIDLFRKLEELGLGSFIAGRKGKPSRFEWKVGLVSVAKAAAGVSALNEFEVIEPEEQAQAAAPPESESDAEDEINGLERELPGEAPITEPFDPSLIRIDSKPLVISNLLARIRNDEIDLSPDFQRNEVWTEEAKSRLIESLLIKIPLPAFYFDGSNDNLWLVVDGLQRISAIRDFAHGELRLKNLEFLKEWESKTFDQLPRNLQRRIEETSLSTFVIQEKTPVNVKYNIFKRINTGGMPLSGQEIRNALNQGQASELLATLAQSAEFLRATERRINDKRKGAQECVLRYLAFRWSAVEDYKSNDLDDFLNTQMGALNHLSEEEVERRADDFRVAMERCASILQGRGIRKPSPDGTRRLPINRALLEAWAVGLAEMPAPDAQRLEIRSNRLLEEFDVLARSSEFDGAISLGTGDPRKVRLRFGEIRRIIAETLA